MALCGSQSGSHWLFKLAFTGLAWLAATLPRWNALSRSVHYHLHNRQHWLFERCFPITTWEKDKKLISSLQIKNNIIILSPLLSSFCLLPVDISIRYLELEPLETWSQHVLLGLFLKTCFLQLHGATYLSIRKSCTRLALTIVPAQSHARGDGFWLEEIFRYKLILNMLGSVSKLFS